MGTQRNEENKHKHILLGQLLSYRRIRVVSNAFEGLRNKID